MWTDASTRTPLGSEYQNTGGPEFKIPRFHCRGLECNPCTETKILHAEQCSQNFKERQTKHPRPLNCCRLSVDKPKGLKLQGAQA